MRYLIFLLLMVSMGAQGGAIKKWVDADGNVHYGDAPPVSAKTQDVRVQAAPTNPGKALPRLSTQSAEGGAGASEPTDDETVPADQAKAACDAAREDLEVIGKSSRIKLRSADGSTRYMTSEEIEERKAQSEADVERFCK